MKAGEIMLSDAYDLIGLINEGKRNSYIKKNCSILTQIGDSILEVGGCIFDKYIDFIKAECKYVKLTSDEQVKYRYRPKELSLDLYGTEELWFLLLKLNNLSSEMDFKPKTMYVLTPDKLSLLNKIQIMNEDEINLNHIEMNMD